MTEELVLPTIITALLTVLAPFVTAWFTKSTMSPKVKNIISLAVSAAIAVVYTLLTGGFEGVVDYATTLGVIFALTNLIYTQLFKPLVKQVEANHGLTAAPTDLRAGAKG